MDQSLKTRIALLYKSYEEWNAYANDYKPIKGEVYFCEIPAGKSVEGIDTSIDRILLKVGDGITSFKQLKWLSSLPATKVGNNAKYKITSAGNGKWKLQVSIDDGDWQDIEGSALIDITAALAAIETLTTDVNELKARMATAEQNIENIKRLSEEEIHEVID